MAASSAAFGDVRGDAPGLVAGEQPLCKRLRKWQIFRAWDEAQNSYAESDCNPARRYRKAALFINGHRSIRGGQGQLALLACLLDNLGRAVPYKRLVTVIGRKSDNWSTRHLLRQYMLVLRVCPDTLGRITKFSKHEPN